MAPVPSRKRTVQALGATAFIPTVVTTIFFTFYSVSTSVHHSMLAIVSIVATVLNICSCILILLFTAFPSHHPRVYRLSGVLPSLLAGMFSAAALAWMNARREDMPIQVVGRSTAAMMSGGFVVFVVAIIAQVVFWTTLILSSASLATVDKMFDSLPTFPCQLVKPKTKISFPSPAASSNKSSIEITVRHSKHRSFVSQVLSSKVRCHGSQCSTLKSTIGNPQHNSSSASSRTYVAERNHFDDWETSDVSVEEHVAASLAVVEQEAMEELGLGITTPRGTDIGTCSHALQTVTKDREAERVFMERTTSPSLPESEVTPRSATFPLKALRVSSFSTRSTIRGSGSMTGETRNWL